MKTVPGKCLGRCTVLESQHGLGTVVAMATYGCTEREQAELLCSSTTVRSSFPLLSPTFCFRFVFSSCVFVILLSCAVTELGGRMISREAQNEGAKHPRPADAPGTVAICRNPAGSAKVPENTRPSAEPSVKLTPGQRCAKTHMDHRLAMKHTCTPS